MSEALRMVRRIVLILVIAALTMGTAWLGLAFHRWWTERPVRAFHTEVENLFQAFHKYKEHVGAFPQGANMDIVKALTGNNPQKVIILAVKPEHLNDKGEIVDPWGTPLRIYFGNNDVLIRSAGPNRKFEDSKVPGGDDYFRAD